MKLKQWGAISLVLVIGVLMLGGTVAAGVMSGGRLRITSRSISHQIKQVSGSVIENQSQSPITVLDFRRRVTLAPGQSSRGIGVVDVDGLLLTMPTRVKGVVYPAGKVLRICDGTRLEIQQDRQQGSQGLKAHWRWPLSPVFDRLSCWAVDDSVSDALPM